MANNIEDLDMKNDLQEMKRLQKDYLRNNLKGNKSTLDFLKSVDDSLLIKFLLGRKGKADYAWETLKHYAEIRFENHPELFPDKLPLELHPLRDCHAAFVLKARDSLGRRIFVFDTRYWNAEEHSIMDLMKFATLLWEKLLRDEDCMKNGLILIHDSSNIGVKHCAQLNIKNIKTLIYLFWHAYPVRFKGIYFVNAPRILAWTINLAKFCFPRKLAERMFIWTGESSYDQLHKTFSKDVLPKFLGGNLESGEAVDPFMIVE